jgi:predicted dehydrogenase
LEGFADSVLLGTPMRGADMADGLASIKTMVAIAQSVASGKSVEVESAMGAL